jgi:MFS family permease
VSASEPSGSAEARLPQPRDFHYFLATRFLGTVAIQIQVVAVGYQVYQITRDPLALGIVALIEFLPMLVLALPAGDFADRVDRRLVICITRLVESVASALLLTVSLLDSQAVWHYYAIVFLFGLTRGVSTPTLQSSLPFLVPTERLPRSIALSSSIGTIGNVSGPFLGGFLLAAGATLTYSICIVLFLCAATSAYRMHMRRPELGPNRGTAVERIRDGLKFIWRRQMIFGAISLDLLAVVVGGAVALLPAYAIDILFVGPVGLGILRGAPAAGAATVGLILARWPLRRKLGISMFGFVAVYGAATIVFGLSTNFYLSLFALYILGCSDMVSIFVRHSLIQLSTPDHMRGRVGAVNSLFISASNEIGQFRAGSMAAWIGIVPAVVIGGVAAIAVVGGCMWLFPALRKVDRFTEVEALEAGA